MNRKQQVLTRRGALSAGAAAGALAAFGMNSKWSSAGEHSEPRLKNGAVILFQGDSITDALRDKKSGAANNPNALGDGYVFMLAGELLRDHAESQIQILNRGNSGNKVPDLQERWRTDCIDLKPDVLSILIGVNDFWHKLSGKYQGTVNDYEVAYRGLLQETRDNLPDARIVICEPFVLRCGSVNDAWFPEFDERRGVAAKLASEFQLTLSPFQDAFDKACQRAPAEFWARDGVHPTIPGHALMAKAWRQATGI